VNVEAGGIDFAMDSSMAGMTGIAMLSARMTV